MGSFEGAFVLVMPFHIFLVVIAADNHEACLVFGVGILAAFRHNLAFM